MSEPCTASTHRVVHPEFGWRIESNARQWVNCGTPDDPEWFTCCEVHEINRRRWSGGPYIPARWVVAPRWVRRIAVWWYRRRAVDNQPA